LQDARESFRSPELALTFPFSFDKSMNRTKNPFMYPAYLQPYGWFFARMIIRVLKT
jgi:hypothetical protein